MYIHIIALILVLFLIFNVIWQNELAKSLFFTICFIIVLWINIPCFVSFSNLEQSNNLATIPFKLNDKFGIIYTLIANLLLGAILYLQSKWTNKVEYSHKEIKRYMIVLVTMQ